MDLKLNLILGILGIIIGFLIPKISGRIISYKLKDRAIKIKAEWLNKKTIIALMAVLNGALWYMAGFLMGNPISAVIISLLFTISILFAVIDAKIHIIPNEMVLATLVIGALFQFIEFGLKSLLIAFLCMLIMMVIFSVVGLIIGLDKVGAGDVKLAGAMGIVLGYPNILTAVLIMSVTMIVYCFFGLLFKKLTMVSMFAFAPFMMLGMISSLLLIALSGHPEYLDMIKLTSY